MSRAGEGEKEREEQREEGGADSPLGREPYLGLNPMTLKLQPELKADI